VRARVPFALPEGMAAGVCGEVTCLNIRELLRDKWKKDSRCVMYKYSQFCTKCEYAFQKTLDHDCNLGIAT
jgi:hypothetical protein